MVDPSVLGSGGGIGNVCRCACQLHDEQYTCDPDEPPSNGCCCRCSPHMFTSILLGVLACVLMTGGVFLAFHKWDYLWLIVSGVGVILVLIGSLLHCCASTEGRHNRARSSGKSGCCGRPPTDHLHGHHLPSNGSLTEQLLPLSNARSVSQLSLNMLPGYFPPVVTTYGIEQHSAVVQNINRLVQQQQQQQQQTQSVGSASPGVSTAAGKSFILLSLPGDTSTTNIQNLVATVYQLDGSVETPSIDPTSSSAQVNVATNPSQTSLVLKNAEVQTCSAWPTVAPSTSSSVASQLLTSSASTSTCNISSETSIPPSDIQRTTTNTASCTVQTEDPIVPPSEIINLMDCSAEIPPVCDNPLSSNTSNDFTNIPVSTVLVDVSETTTEATELSGVIIEPANAFSESPIAEVLVDVANTDNLSDASQASSNVLIEISAQDAPSINGNQTSGEVDLSTSINASSSIADDPLEGPSTRTDGVLDVSDIENGPLVTRGSEVSLSCSNLSELDGEVDDEELMRSSSPPPSYDDVAHEGENSNTNNNTVGAFGLAYGTM